MPNGAGVQVNTPRNSVMALLKPKLLEVFEGSQVHDVARKNAAISAANGPSCAVFVAYLAVSCSPPELLGVVHEHDVTAQHNKSRGRGAARTSRPDCKGQLSEREHFPPQTETGAVAWPYPADRGC